MNKKRFNYGVTLLAIASLLMVQVGSALAMGDTTTPEYNEKTVVEDLNFTATLNQEGNVDTTWSEYTPEGFNYYKVVRSQENQDPVYPDDSYIYATGAGDLAYTDLEVPAGTSYYRVCSIAKPERYCSPVVTIENGEAEPPVEIDPQDLAVLTLEGSVNNDLGKMYLEWTVDDEAKVPNGFKIAYSKTNTEPVYPGDSYHYLTDPTTRTDTITDAKPGYTYYFRVCQYDGTGTCLAYSNVVELMLEGIPVEDKTFDTTKSFTDTKEHWAETYADKLKSSCDVYGYKDEAGNYLYEFEPDQPISRAELVKMLVQCKHGDMSGFEGETFSDVEAGAWYEGYVAKAKYLGWIEGYIDGTFHPNEEVNRAEALKMILLSKYADGDILGGEADFSDVSSEWFAKYVAFAVKMAYVQGYADGSFGPGNDITRAEVAKIIALVQGL
jgi:hypothetical protein